jgi:hypothetical protein
MGRFDGWRREAREEDIDGLADHEFNNRARRVYDEAFEAAKNLVEKNSPPDDIRRQLSMTPRIVNNPYDDGRPIPVHIEAGNRAETRLAALTKEAIEDAIAGRRPRGTL